MTRTALARRYRPRRFGDLALQDHVSATLSSAVAKGRVGHAYLFCGPRGVGKTTAARVLAMALNCPRRTPEGEPCGECESCTRIWSGKTSLDVVEIDAASNRGVEDARDLRERAMYAPTGEQRYKVYIVDEAHMLTREAWNALLKILEEPPPRVIFVFATTEPQRIQQAAPPILSRCQRFDFRRMTVTAIVDRLAEVIVSEGVEADPEALLPLARRADGGMRDALSLLDQVLSFAEGRIQVEDVRRVLGLADREVFTELFELIAERRAADVFPFVRRLIDGGHDLGEFHRDLADAIRDLLVVKLQGPAELDLPAGQVDSLASVAARYDTGELLRMLARTAELDVEGRLRKSRNPRLLLESLLLRFAHLDRTVEIEALIRAAGGDAADVASAPPPTRAPVPGATLERDRGQAETARQSTSPPPARTGPQGVEAREEEAPVAGELDGAAALRALLAEGSAVPRGLQVFLRSARVEESGDRMVLSLPPGPGLERLSSDGSLQRELEGALGRRMGRPIRLEVAAAESVEDRPGAGERITPERLREERLRRLAEEEPVLGRAVQEWDLELMD